jgi:hypothetical protein
MRANGIFQVLDGDKQKAVVINSVHIRFPKIRGRLSISWEHFSFSRSYLDHNYSFRESLVYLLVFNTYFYWGFKFLKGSLRDVFIGRSALKG